MRNCEEAVEGQSWQTPALKGHCPGTHGFEGLAALPADKIPALATVGLTATPPATAKHCLADRDCVPEAGYQIEPSLALMEAFPGGPFQRQAAWKRACRGFVGARWVPVGQSPEPLARSQDKPSCEPAVQIHEAQGQVLTD